MSWIAMDHRHESTGAKISFHNNENNNNQVKTRQDHEQRNTKRIYTKSG